jgi:hypothetical protein
MAAYNAKQGLEYLLNHNFKQKKIYADKLINNDKN